MVDTARIERLVGGGGGFVERWFTAAEIAQCRRSCFPAREFAARLAAKEAVWKALRPGAWTTPLHWRDVGTIGASHGLGVVLTGRASELARGAGAARISVCVQLEQNIAIAVALIERENNTEVITDVPKPPEFGDTPN